MFRVYGRKNCVWCDRAKELLDANILPYEYYDIEEDKSARADYKYTFFGATTVPRIMLMTPNDGDHEYKIIGGYKELYDWVHKHYTKKP